MAKKNKIGKTATFIIGVGLIIFALVPTPDDAFVLPPLAAAGYGIKLITEAIR